MNARAILQPTWATRSSDNAPRLRLSMIAANTNAQKSKSTIVARSLIKSSLAL